VKIFHQVDYLRGPQMQKTPPGANLAGVKHGGAVLNARKCKKARRISPTGSFLNN
jgi:hypothetical protein